MMMEFHDRPVMTMIVAMTKAKMCSLTENDRDSAYWTLDAEKKAAFFGFATEYQNPEVLIKIATEPTAKIGQGTENDTKPASCGAQ